MRSYSIRGAGAPDVCTLGNILGIDGGGTATTAVVATENLEMRAQAAFGPGNVRLLSDRDLRALFMEVRGFCPNPARIGIGMAGARGGRDRRRIEAALGEIWPAVPHLI